MTTRPLMCLMFLLMGTVDVAQKGRMRPLCDDNAPTCTETYQRYNYEGNYTGHDEPSLLFYSNTAGSGNSNVYRITLPTDPPTLPEQDGTGGTFNFQLHPAFWFGMAMCDTQSFPNFTTTCTPDSDANIFDNPDPTAPDYIGHHPGTAFMEMQFYPPGWVPWPPGNSCDGSHYCAALNIDSFSENPNTGQINNAACLNTVGIEPVNFAFITKNGVAHAPANPVDATLATYTPNPTTDLFMNPGDTLIVDMHNTPSGFQVVMHDLTTGETGSMTASIGNGFGQVKFDPSGTTCQNLPYAFHPMYSTSSEHTRVPWAAHSYNVAFSDEIGHFEYCNAVSAEGGVCTQPGVNDPKRVDSDDSYCFDAAASTRIPIGGCFGSDIDFDGVPYQHTWPGTLTDPTVDSSLNPSPIRFTSPLFMASTGELTNYGRIAFEADLPRIEFSTRPPCNRRTGAQCVNPPEGANFYPFYTTTSVGNACSWQLGGPFIPGTTNFFGGSSTTEFGSLLQLFYPSSKGPVFIFEDFRRILPNNPCPQ